MWTFHFFQHVQNSNQQIQTVWQFDFFHCFNVGKCKEVGDKVLRSMARKNAHDYSFRKKD